MDATHKQPPRVAIAEDDPAAQVIIERLLRKLGYAVGCVASNGAELLERCRVERFDVVLTDLDMPEVDGLEAAEEIARLGLPVILVSGHADLQQLVLDREPVMTALRKPIDLDELGRALACAMRQSPGG